MKGVFVLLFVSIFLVSFVFAVSNNASTLTDDNVTLSNFEDNSTSEDNDTFEDNSTLEDNNQENEDLNDSKDDLEETLETDANIVCCHKFGYGNQMKKVNSQYQIVKKENCVTPEGFVGGGREIVDNSYCKNLIKKRIQAKNQIKNKMQRAIKIKNRLREYDEDEECPEKCVCTGSVIKCEMKNGRNMTIIAGKSGNTIVQVKGENMTTRVALYKNEGRVYGVFKNNKTRVVNLLPDQVKERLRKKIKAKLEINNITLDDEARYHVEARKRARLFFVFPIRERVRTEINSETGEIVKTKTSWWGFLARDIREKEIVGESCGTVTPGENDACCEKNGYDYWDAEKSECLFDIEEDTTEQ